MATSFPDIGAARPSIIPFEFDDRFRRRSLFLSNFPMGPSSNISLIVRGLLPHA